MNTNKEVVTFVMDTMRSALLTISDVAFTDMNKNMCIAMRAIARGALKECAEAIGEKPKDDPGKGAIPVKEECVQ